MEANSTLIAPARGNMSEGGEKDIGRRKRHGTQFYKRWQGRLSEGKERASHPAYDDPLRNKAAIFLRSKPLETFLGFVIMFNVIVIIMETDAASLSDDGEIPQWIYVTNITLLVLYFIEMVVKIIVFRKAYFRDPWNILDCSIVVLDFSLTMLSFAPFGEAIAPLRIFRVGKVARAFRVLRQFQELEMLLRCFAAAIKSICWGMGMVMTFIVIWAVVGVQMLHPINKEIWDGREAECERCSRAFRTVFEAGVTIFQSIIAGDSWGQVSIPIIEARPWTIIYFVAVLVSVSLAMMNLILAVIVESAQDAKAQSLEEIALDKEQTLQAHKLKLLHFFKQMDKDGDGILTMEEFASFFESDDDFASTLVALDVHGEDVEAIFAVLDIDCSGEVQYEEFVEQLSRLHTQEIRTILYSVTEIRQLLKSLQPQNSQQDDKPEAQAEEKDRRESKMSGYTATSSSSKPSRSVSFAESVEYHDSKDLSNKDGTPSKVASTNLSILEKQRSEEVSMLLEEVIQSTDRKFERMLSEMRALAQRCDVMLQAPVNSLAWPDLQQQDVLSERQRMSPLKVIMPSEPGGQKVRGWI
eukprot:TRINITY_DN77645_c0_g1_i1.p1 TRINITY_DN77645_c0_g1~~TRINITY_DN77645_c0_g1_i1.p1  ORF type:complete len:582 (-),score=131.95 TRINITY_DN77645_c0_g1_i1:83-1828(-)